MARELKNHPGMFINEAAAADFDRAENEHGIFTVNSAKRSEADQQSLINRWDVGGKYNRPPYLYEPFRPAKDGPHVRNDGIALDIAEWEKFEKIAAQYNFDKPHKWDVVHFEHNGNRSTLISENIGDEMTQQIRVNQNNSKLNGLIAQVGPDYFAALTNMGSADIVRNVFSSKDERHQLSEIEFLAITDTCGIPREEVKAGNYWTRALKIERDVAEIKAKLK